MVWLGGIDASHFQGDVDWGAVHRAGNTFAIIKATEGTSYSWVPWFRENWPKLRASGLVPGAYHFLRGDRDPKAQARYFVSVVGSFDGALAVVDVETAANGTKPSGGQARDFAAEFHRLVPNHPLIVYTGRWYWRDTIGDPHGAGIGPLWHSEYETTAAEVSDGPEAWRYGGWDRWTIWQWTSTGRVSGVSGNVDRNKFNGDLAALRRLTGTQQEEPDLTPEQDQLLRRTAAAVVPFYEVGDGRFQVRTHIRRELAANNAKLLAAIKGIDIDADVTLDAEDVAALAETLVAAGIGPAVAQAIGEKLTATSG